MKCSECGKWGCHDAAHQKANAAKADGAKIADVVYVAFMETGDDIDVKEIAKRIGWSESKIRRVMSDNHGVPRGVTVSDESRPTYSRSYPTMQSGYVKVNVYGPTRSEMRRRMLAAGMFSHVAAAVV